MKLHFILLIGVLNICWASGFQKHYQSAKCIEKKGEWSPCTKQCFGEKSRIIYYEKIGKDKPGTKKLQCSYRKSKAEIKGCDKKGNKCILGNTRLIKPLNMDSLQNNDATSLPDETWPMEMERISGTSIEDQVVEDVCTLPLSKGPCRNFAPSFYFKGESGKCEYFIYGGCGGNGNRFESLEDCKTRCNTESSLGVCSLPLNRGSGRGLAPMFYFNGEFGKCEFFIFGGIGGNGNRFATLEECEARCIITL